MVLLEKKDAGLSHPFVVLLSTNLELNKLPVNQSFIYNKKRGVD